MATPAAALTALSAVLVLVGIGLASAGLVVVRGYRRMRRADPSDPGELGSGLVAVAGRARERDGLVTAPLTGTDCLAYTLDAEKRQLSWMTMWDEYPSEEASVTFRVRDGTGEVVVDPDGAETVFEESARVVLGREDLASDRRGDYGDLVASLDEWGSRWPVDPYPSTDLGPGEKLRFTERRLDVDDPAYVFGAAERRSAGPVRIADPVERGGPLGELERAVRSPFVVGDGTKSAVEERIGQRLQTGWALLVSGVGVSLFGLVLLPGLP